MSRSFDLNPKQDPSRQVIVDRLFKGVLINHEAELLTSCKTDHEADLAYTMICDDWVLYGERNARQDEVLATLFSERPLSQSQFDALRLKFYGVERFTSPE